ncbi:MAG: methylated-DNA--[protein]-cysteine S-methyltransferase [Erysipelotrichaceae bacterium]|nr:methylated-DNA--[protein]-cysteine S-methyltransferase [Erysipelotrichaceae bacterium]
MNYVRKYRTPEGFSDLVMVSDGTYLTGLCFEGSEDIKDIGGEEKDLPVFTDTVRWLDIYFQGKKPDFVPEYKADAASSFRKEVWKLLEEIPCGKTVTYGELAEKIAERKGIRKMSAQAVGNAVGANPICIIVPCHRVMGRNGNLTGYGGGLKNKLALLKLEGIDTEGFHYPK